ALAVGAEARVGDAVGAELSDLGVAAAVLAGRLDQRAVGGLNQVGGGVVKAEIGHGPAVAVGPEGGIDCPRARDAHCRQVPRTGRGKQRHVEDDVAAGLNDNSVAAVYGGAVRVSHESAAVAVEAGIDVTIREEPDDRDAWVENSVSGGDDLAVVGVGGGCAVVIDSQALGESVVELDQLLSVAVERVVE